MTFWTLYQLDEITSLLTVISWETSKHRKMKVTGSLLTKIAKIIQRLATFTNFWRIFCFCLFFVNFVIFQTGTFGRASHATSAKSVVPRWTLWFKFCKQANIKSCSKTNGNTIKLQNFFIFRISIKRKLIDNELVRFCEVRSSIDTP